MDQNINAFFDSVKLIVERVPIVNKLIVELTLIGLAAYGAFALFARHP